MPNNWADDFWEVVDTHGTRYLVYYCKTCRGRHVLPYKNISKLRQLNKAGELVLWCGNGKPPEFKSDEVLHIRINPKPAPPRATSQRIKRQIDLIQRSGMYRPRNIPEAQDAVQHLKHQIVKLDQEQKNIIATRERISTAIKKLEVIK